MATDPSPPAPPSADAVAEHRSYLMRVASRRVRDRALAEDAVHDTLVAALQGAAPFAGRASARTWLTAILLRRLADAVRREVRAGAAARAATAEPVDDAGGEGGEHGPMHHALVERRDPQRLLEGRQSMRSLEQCLRQLPAEVARVVVLRDIEGLDTRDTARRLGVDVAWVSLTLHRARQRLRGCLARAGSPAAPALGLHCS